MQTKLKNCASCGKLFSAPEGVRACGPCIDEEARVRDLVDRAVEIHGLKTAGAIAKFAELPVDTVKRVIRLSRVLSQVTSIEELCKRCEQRTALKRSDYCVLCSLEIHASIRDTVVELNTKIAERNARPEARFRSRKVREVIREKRTRTGSNHTRREGG